MIPTASNRLLPYDLSAAVPPVDEPEAVDIRSVLRFLRKSLRLCLIWLVAAVCAAVAFIAFAPAYYTAYALILLEDPTAAALAEQGGPPIPAPDPAYADSQVEVLQSDEVLEKVVDQDRRQYGQAGLGAEEGLLAFVSRIISGAANHEAAASSPAGAGAANGPVATPTPVPRARTPVMHHFKRGLTVRRVGVSNVVEIGFTSRDPTRSAAVANAVAHSYINNQLDRKRVAFDEASKRLDERLAELRDKAFGVDPSLSPTEAGGQALSKSRELQSRTETYRALYNNLLQRHFTETADRLSPGARVITPADPPAERSWPKALLVLAVAIACGGAGGIGHALLRHATDRTIRTVEDAQQATGIDLVVGIPKIKKQAWRPGRSRNGLQSAYTSLSAKYSEVMGTFVVRLQGRQPRKGGLIIAVVAPSACVGTSSVAANLARIVAESGQRTLLVDANWRKPSIDQHLSEPNPGRALASGFAMINLATERLVVLVLRSIAPISELNATLSIIATLQQQRAEYDCVVVDFPSIEQTADFEASMATIDEVIVVVEAGGPSSERLSGFLRLVPKNKIAAVVLNKV